MNKATQEFSNSTVSELMKWSKSIAIKVQLKTDTTNSDKTIYDVVKETVQRVFKFIT